MREGNRREVPETAYRFRQGTRDGTAHVEASKQNPFAFAVMLNLPVRLASPTAVMVRVGAVTVALLSLVVF